MPISLAAPDPLTNDRPIVSDLFQGPDGRRFTVRFAPGQSLPPHRNAARVAITAVAGSGEITVDGHAVRALPAGSSVQLEPNAQHSVVASAEGLELRVDLIARCCDCC